MTRASPDLVRLLRQRYENTDQLMTSIAAEFGIGLRTLGRLRLTEGWRKRSERTRSLPIALGLLEEAKALAQQASHPSRLAALAPQDDGATLPLASGASQTPVDRLEALVVQEIEAEEAARAQLIGKRRVVGAAERSARTLATLTQTLHALQRLRAGQPIEPEITDDDDMPRDIDEFRHALARRIRAFVESRTRARDADGNSGSPGLDAAG